MTDKATMPEEVWIGRRSRSDGGLWWDRGGRFVTSYTLTEKYDSLAAVAGRMIEALHEARKGVHPQFVLNKIIDDVLKESGHE